MKAFDRVKDIKEPWRFFKKIEKITEDEWGNGGGSPAVVVFIALVQQLSCLEYLREDYIFLNLRKKSNLGFSAHRGVMDSEECERLMNDGKFGYALAIAQDSPRKGRLLVQAMMKMFAAESKLTKTPVSDIKKELLPTLKIAVAYGVD